jgi:hypothetical protein
MLPDTDKPLTLAGRHGGRRRRPGAVVYAMFCKPMREREREGESIWFIIAHKAKQPMQGSKRSAEGSSSTSVLGRVHRLHRQREVRDRQRVARAGRGGHASRSRPGRRAGSQSQAPPLTPAVPITSGSGSGARPAPPPPCLACAPAATS